MKKITSFALVLTMLLTATIFPACLFDHKCVPSDTWSTDADSHWHECSDEKCEEILFNCVNIIVNVNTILKAYLPNSSQTVERYLNYSNKAWEYYELDSVNVISQIETLYTRYDKKVIEEEINAHLAKKSNHQ